MTRLVHDSDEALLLRQIDAQVVVSAFESNGWHPSEALDAAVRMERVQLRLPAECGGCRSTLSRLDPVLTGSSLAGLLQRRPHQW